jgi:hypothetical protein
MAQLLLMIALVGVIVVGALFLTGVLPPNKPTPAPPPSNIVQQPEPELAEPIENTPAPTPEPPVIEEAPVPAPAQDPLPKLDESDDDIRDAVADIPLGNAGQQYLMSSNVIERGTSMVYLMVQGEVPYKLLPIARPKEAFPIADDGTQVTVSAEGFARYDALAQWLMSLDVEALTAALARFNPLFREAWSYYGEEAEAFDFAVISALDMIASTPDVDLAGARLVRKEAVWLYEDPDIEGLPAIQKQVLRMGPDNAAIVKDKASQARTVWVATLSEAP